jgi:hypothetical protein
MSTNTKSANEVEDFLSEMAKEVQVKTEPKSKTEADDSERSPRNGGNDERSDRRGDRYDHRSRYPQQRELKGERQSSRDGDGKVNLHNIQDPVYFCELHMDCAWRHHPLSNVEKD